MTGFKSGSAGDPFSSDDEDEEEDASDDDVETSVAADAETQRDLGDDRDGRHDDDRGEDSNSGGASSVGLPWIYERDSITDGRKKTVQLHLQKSTLDRQREGKTSVEDVLGESVKKADLREAALLVGLEHIDEVADQLREWGYDFE